MVVVVELLVNLLYSNKELGGDDQPIDIDNIVDINRANGEQGLGAEAYLRASRNDHIWYGCLSTL